MSPSAPVFRSPITLCSFFIVAFLALAPVSEACSPVPDARSFSQRFYDAPVSFIGTVSSADNHHVVFQVEQAFKGVRGPIYELDTQMSTCHIAFEAGQRWLYAGNLTLDPSVRLSAASSGPDSRLHRLDDRIIQLSRDLQSCTSNSDCAALDYGCSRTAVRTEFFDEAQRQAFERGGDPKAVSCPSGTMDNSVPFPVCDAGICGIWGF